MPVPVDDLEAWFHSPVTQEFYRVIALRQRQVYDERMFYEGDSQRTQDAMSWQNGAGDMLQEILDMKEDGTIYFEGEASERIGNIPERPTGTDQAG